MYHRRYCLAQQYGISSNITNGTRFSTPPRSPTLSHQPPYQSLYTAHVNRTDTSPMLARQTRNPRQHTTHAGRATHTSMSPTTLMLARPPCKYDIHAFYASTPSTQARHQRNPRQHKQHAISETPTNVVLFQCFYFTIIPNDGDGSKCATFVQSAQLNHGFMVKSFDFFKVFQLLQLSSLSRDTLNFQLMLVSYERINQLND